MGDVRRHRERALATVLTAGVVVVACGGPANPPTSGPPAAPAAPAFAPPPPPPPAPVSDRCPPAPPAVATPDPAVLSLHEKIGLLLVVGIPGATAGSDPEVEAVLATPVGGLVLKGENVRSVDQTRALVEQASARSRHGLLVFVDHEGGRVAHAAATIEPTPSARRLGGEGPDRAREAGAAIGTALREMGVHVNLAPVADLDGGHHQGIIGDRAFGDTPESAGPAAAAFLEGLHGRGTLGVVKHFPGYAGADDTHHAPAISDESVARLRQLHLRPFRDVLDAGAQAVMLGHVTYPALGDLPASLDRAAYALLRDEGFDGVTVTDSLGMGAVHRGRGHGRAAVEALAAGADLLLANQGSEAAREMHQEITEAVRSGEVSPGRLDEAVRRVLWFRVHQTRVAAGCR